MTKFEVFYLIYKKEIEQGDSLILVILGSLDHFRSFVYANA
jgi:hypothetical protein